MYQLHTLTGIRLGWETHSKINSNKSILISINQWNRVYLNQENTIIAKKGSKILKKIKLAGFQRVFLNFCGDGGSRTLVQTRNPHAFYMLIPPLFFVLRKGEDALNATLSSEFRPGVEAPTGLSWNCLAPRTQTGIRRVHLRDVSSTHLVSGLSLNLLCFG